MLPTESTPLLGAQHQKNSRTNSANSNEHQQQQQQQQQSIHQLIHRIRFDLLTLIDTPLSTEQLTSPAITFSITRPLELTYFNLEHQAIIFALLVNRTQFITDSTHALTLHSVNATRASLCELLATNILRRVHESDLLKNLNPPPSSKSNKHKPAHYNRHTVNQKLTPEEEEACLLKSANVLATAFSLFEGAPTQVISSLEADWGTSDAKNVLSRQSNALEMAIVSEAKQFIRSPACQRVIDAIWTGKIVYTSTAIVDILSDRYKHRPVSLYNPRNAPLLNHYRLTVPRNRAALEYFHYAILILSYVTTLQTRQLNKMNGFEIWFNVFTIGFAADKLGSILEHGWLVFIANLWNGFDAAFILGHSIYLALRITGLVYLSHYELESHWLNEQSHQVLSCLAILIFPRLAFITLSDNILILSLRSMLSDFVFLMLLGAWCFLGFGYSLYSLQRGKVEAGEESPYSIGEIAIWMVYIFFGLDATGIANAHEFHRILGPAIFIIYACLSNTLLVTVLVSILSKIFSDISNDSIAETLYRKAVLTFEGVKSDALFSFQPPFNIPAMMILIPLKPFLTPRKFHTVVVFLCRMMGCPVLLTISFFERYVVGPFDKDRNSVGNSLKLTVANSLGGLALNHFNSIMKGNGAPSSGSGRRRTTMSKMSSRISRNLRKFGGLAVINACFDYEPYPPVRNESEAQEAEDQLRISRERKVSFEHSQLTEEPDQIDEQDSTVRKRPPYQSTSSSTAMMHSSSQSSSSNHNKPIEGSSELENGTCGTAKQANRLGLFSAAWKSKSHLSNFGQNMFGQSNNNTASGRELTTLEKLFLPHAGMVSTFVGPVPTSNPPPTPPLPPPPVLVGAGKRKISGTPSLTKTNDNRDEEEILESDCSSSSSTIEEDRSPLPPRPAPPANPPPSSTSIIPSSSSSSSRPATMYLDPPRTSLGGNHKPASIMLDEAEENKLEHRIRKRHNNHRLNSSSASSVIHLSTKSSRKSLLHHDLPDPDHSISDDDDEDDDDGNDTDEGLTHHLLQGSSERQYPHNTRHTFSRKLTGGASSSVTDNRHNQMVLVSMDDLELLIKAQFEKLESKLLSSLQNQNQNLTSATTSEVGHTVTPPLPPTDS
ncbi:hypothetical protein Pst134EA_021450 [Puccinia striiformis f. sp. tritici]|uniref:hypothetical protein n=1 Tax=Puccinia striiformis f. sp. tritici TaxID=168172 RepID=UPI002008369D|nr:hypothetical protein Pst134EA_021450 [Puccinia striiformis f. sp. tritici]KAH9457577.1 hypothetical protein Pst134EA_021450 [Puccinia striiformis f. sp. tritici]